MKSMTKSQLEYANKLLCHFGSDATPVQVFEKTSGPVHEWNTWALGITHPEDTEGLNLQAFSLFVLLITPEGNILDGFTCTKEEAVERWGFREGDIEQEIEIVKQWCPA